LDLHTDYYDELEIPLAHQSFDVIDDLFPIFDDTKPISSAKTFNENNSIILNDGTSSAGESQLTAEDESLRWIIDEVQISLWPTQLRSAGDTIIISDDKMDSPQILIIEKVQKKTAPAEPPPTVELLIETPTLEGRRLDVPLKYNTRRACYKKNISNFIV